MLRCFVAIPFSPPPLLAKASADLRREFEPEKIRWVALDIMHVTLRFFGDIPPEIAGEVAGRLEETFSGEKRFDVRVRGLDLFYDRERRPVVLWAGLDDNGRLSRMREQLDAVLSEIELPGINKRFRPHLTLARVKKLRNREHFTDRIARFSGEDLGRMEASKIILYRSILRQEGPEYHVLKAVGLGM